MPKGYWIARVDVRDAAKALQEVLDLFLRAEHLPNLRCRCPGIAIAQDGSNL